MFANLSHSPIQQLSIDHSMVIDWLFNYWGKIRAQ